MRRRSFGALRTTGDSAVAQKSRWVIDGLKRSGHNRWLWGYLIFLCSGCATPHQYDKSEVYFPDETICHPYRTPVECKDGHCSPNARLEVDCEISRRN